MLWATLPLKAIILTVIGPKKRVHGGSNVKITDYPFQASVVIFFTPGDDQSWSFCGGTIYNKRYIITAAHCAYKQNEEDAEKLELIPSSSIVVYLGREDIYYTNYDKLIKGEQKFGVEKFITHENFKAIVDDHKEGASGYDIGLIRLDKDIIYSDSLKPLRIQTCPPKQNELAVVTGFGNIAKLYLNKNPFPTLPDKLQAAKLKILTREECLDLGLKVDYHKLYDGPQNDSFIKSVTAKKRCINKDTFCAHDETKSACSGDSGGPLVCGTKECPKLCGIVSYGETCGLGQPGFFVDVHKFKCWIRKHAGDQDFK